MIVPLFCFICLALGSLALPIGAAMPRLATTLLALVSCLTLYRSVVAAVPTGVSTFLGTILMGCTLSIADVGLLHFCVLSVDKDDEAPFNRAKKRGTAIWPAICNVLFCTIPIPILLTASELSTNMTIVLQLLLSLLSMAITMAWTLYRARTTEGAQARDQGAGIQVGMSDLTLFDDDDIGVQPAKARVE